MLRFLKIIAGFLSTLLTIAFVVLFTSFFKTPLNPYVEPPVRYVMARATLAVIAWNLPDLIGDPVGE